MKKKRLFHRKAEETPQHELSSAEENEDTAAAEDTGDGEETLPEMNERDEMTVMEERDRADEEEAEELVRRISWELQEIGKHDPSVRTVEDLAKLDRADEISERLARGYTYLDAYESVYRDRIAASAKARQSAFDSARSKAHLVSTTQRGTGSVPVPEAELALYRALIPQAAAGEILRNYNNYINH